MKNGPENDLDFPLILTTGQALSFNRIPQPASGFVPNPSKGGNLLLFAFNRCVGSGNPMWIFFVPPKKTGQASSAWLQSVMT